MNSLWNTSNSTVADICAMSRRQWIVGTGISLAGFPSVAAPTTLPSTTSLLDELALALKVNSPLVVMVSLEGCPFCKIARENYLGPMRAQQGLPVVQIDMRNRLAIKDLKGVTTTQDDLIRSWGIKVAPTLLFFGRGGVEVAERMVGGYIPDFYGAYLDERLRAARLLDRHASDPYLPNLHARTDDAIDPDASASFFVAGFDSMWEFGLFGKRDSAKRVARAQLDAATVGVAGARVSLIAEVVRNWIELRSAQHKEAILSRIRDAEVERLRLLHIRQINALSSSA